MSGEEGGFGSFGHGNAYSAKPQQNHRVIGLARTPHQRARRREWRGLRAFRAEPERSDIHAERVGRAESEPRHPFPGLAGEGGAKRRMGCGPRRHSRRIARPSPSSCRRQRPAFHTPSGPTGHLPQPSWGRGDNGGFTGNVAERQLLAHRFRCANAQCPASTRHAHLSLPAGLRPTAAPRPLPGRAYAGPGGGEQRRGRRSCGAEGE